jgi:hypothetical protein
MAGDGTHSSPAYRGGDCVGVGHCAIKAAHLEEAWRMVNGFLDMQRLKPSHSRQNDKFGPLQGAL